MNARHAGASVASQRALKAAALVLVMVLSVPAIEVLADSTEAPIDSRRHEGGIDLQNIVGSADPYEALSRIEAMANADCSDVPEAFSREVGLLPGAQDVRVDATGTVVGYTVAGDAEVVLGELEEHMESRGWVAVSLGGVDGATFAKSGGSCTWALATCTQVDGLTSVVMRCACS